MNIGRPKLLTYHAKQRGECQRDAQLSDQSECGHAEDHQDLVETRDEKEAHDKATAGAELTQHLVVRHVGGDALLHGEALAQEHETVDQRRHEHKADLPLPETAGHARGVHETHRNRHEAPEHQPSGPSGMQDVEILGLLAVEQRRRHGIHDRLDGPVAERVHERPKIEQRKAVPLTRQHRLRACPGIGQREAAPPA